jgi:hypothetical protein
MLGGFDGCIAMQQVWLVRQPAHIKAVGKGYKYLTARSKSEQIASSVAAAGRPCAFSFDVVCHCLSTNSATCACHAMRPSH